MAVLPRIVCLDSAPADDSDMDWSPIERLGSLTLHRSTTATDVAGRLDGATIALTNKVRIDEAVLAACPSLRMIGVLATGFDVVDVRAAKAHGVVVCNVPGYATASTAQLAIHLLLELAWGVGRHDAAVHEGAWSRSSTFAWWQRPLVELDGKTLVVVGRGAIGGRVAAIAEALGMKVIAAAVPGAPARPDRVPLDEALALADAVSLHCPLTEATRGLMSADRLALMRPTAWLVNTARGAVVDEQAIRCALDQGTLGGYATDVLSSEPPPPDHVLLGAPRCIITPHTGWATREARARLLATTAGNIEAFLSGAPTHVVNP